MDFSLSAEHQALQAKVRRFIADKIIPLEKDPRQSVHGPSEALRNELVEKARDAELLTPHASREFGGRGLSHVGKAIVFEEAGYSTLGPTALNIHAPDEGNIHLLEAVATKEQKERWLRPMVQGRLRSCFAMTEPPPGAGADPSMLATTAVRDGDHLRDQRNQMVHHRGRRRRDGDYHGAHGGWRRHNVPFGHGPSGNRIGAHDGCAG